MMAREFKTARGIRQNYSPAYYSVIFLLFLYFSQSLLHIGGIAAQAIMCLTLAVGVFSWISVTFIPSRPAFVKVISYFYILIVAVWVISEKSVHSPQLGEIPTSVLLKNTSMVCLMLFTGYWIGRNSFIGRKQETTVCIIVLLTAVLQYIIVGESAGLRNDRFTNNGAYCLVSALPFIVPLLRKNKTLAVVCFAIITAGVVASGKRGAVVCLTSALAFYYFAYPGNSSGPKWERILSAVLLTGLAALSLFLETTQNPYLRERLLQTWQGYSSGRDLIYDRCLNAWLNEPDELIILFGRGLSQTINVAGNYAHSDWLELLTDAGLPGVFIYALFFAAYIRFIKRRKPHIECNRRFNMNLIMLLLFIESLFSMGFMAIFNCFDTLMLGVLAAQSIPSRIRTMSYSRSVFSDIHIYNSDSEHHDSNRKPEKEFHRNE